MKTLKSFCLLLILLLVQLIMSAQVQWYQNQSANDPFPNGTVGTSIQTLTKNSFIACYQWSVNNESTTWKISKSHINGTEQKCFFITGSYAVAEVKVGVKNELFILERTFPLGQNAQYNIYRLDTNLVVKSQKSIQFPNDFNIFNLNAFQVDNADNVYVAGDGQYPNGPGFNPASFIVKMDRGLQTKWSRMDSTLTSYSQLHVDRDGNVIVIADFYTFFPDIKVTRIKSNGYQANITTIQTDAGRFNLYSTLDDEDNLLIYGGKSVNDTTQGMFIYKVSRFTGHVVFRKTLFNSYSTQVNDLKIDHNGNIYTLVSQYLGPDNQIAKVSRINSYNGFVYWSRNFKYAQDSCNLFKLVMNNSDKFYVVGEKRSHNYFSKGLAYRLKKNGQTDGDYISPDSIKYDRSHWLTDGISDRDDQLIAIGGTNDLDTLSFASTYLRSFAIRYGRTGREHNDCDNAFQVAAVQQTVASDELSLNLNSKLVLYPNPVDNQLSVANLKDGEYDQLTIYSLQGVVLKQQAINGATAHIDVSVLSSGLYVLALQSSSAGTKSKTMKFVIRR